MSDFDEAAAWSIRLPPDFDMACAWSIRHLPDIDQAAAWSNRLPPDFDLVCAWSIRHSLISGWEVAPDLPEQYFWSCSENQAIRQTSLKCEKSEVSIIVLKIHFYLINLFRAHFLLKCHPNLRKYYKFTCRTKPNLKIRHCLISGGCLIDQAHARSKSGGRLIDQAAAWSKSGSCLIDQANARSKSGSSLIDQAAAWSKSSSCLIDQAHARSKSVGSLIDQAAAWSKSGSCLIDQDPGLWEV